MTMSIIIIKSWGFNSAKELVVNPSETEEYPKITLIVIKSVNSR